MAIDLKGSYDFRRDNKWHKGGMAWSYVTKQLPKHPGNMAHMFVLSGLSEKSGEVCIWAANMDW
jgi:hypothetical protein